MSPALSRTEVAAVSAEVAGRLSASLVPAAARTSAAASAFTAQGLRGFSVTRAASLRSTVLGATLVLLARPLPEVTPVADALLDVPFTGNVTAYEPVRQFTALLVRAADRSGVDAGRWASRLWVPENDGRPGPFVPSPQLDLRADGRLLARTRQGPPEERGQSPRVETENQLLELWELGLVWVLDRGPSWPRARVDEVVEHVVGRLSRLGALPAD